MSKSVPPNGANASITALISAGVEGTNDDAVTRANSTVRSVPASGNVPFAKSTSGDAASIRRDVLGLLDHFVGDELERGPGRCGSIRPRRAGRSGRSLGQIRDPLFDPPGRRAGQRFEFGARLGLGHGEMADDFLR